MYQSEDGKSRVQVRLEDGHAWLTQQQIAELFESSKQNVSLHIQNIYEDKELQQDRVVKEYLTTAADGKRYRVKYYNLDMILAVGYRVRSSHGVQFRRWASEKLKEYITKGFVLDDERLKGNDALAEHFEELLARIRDIWASERKTYQRVRDIFALAADYVVPGSFSFLISRLASYANTPSRLWSWDAFDKRSGKKSRQMPRLQGAAAAGGPGRGDCGPPGKTEWNRSAFATGER